jgi:hypothetical protein
MICLTEPCPLSATVTPIVAQGLTLPLRREPCCSDPDLNTHNNFCDTTTKNNSLALSDKPTPAKVHHCLSAQSPGNSVPLRSGDTRLTVNMSIVTKVRSPSPAARCPSPAAENIFSRIRCRPHPFHHPTDFKNTRGSR